MIYRDLFKLIKENYLLREIKCPHDKNCPGVEDKSLLSNLRASISVPTAIADSPARIDNPIDTKSKISSATKNTPKRPDTAPSEKNTIEIKHGLGAAFQFGKYSREAFLSETKLHLLTKQVIQGGFT